MFYRSCVRLLAAALLFSLNARTVLADPTTGEIMAGDIDRDCHLPLQPGDNAKMFAEIYCLGYLQGAAASFSHLETLKQMNPAIFSQRLICLPDNVTNQQILDVVRGFLARTPNTSDVHGDLIVFAALHDAYPCK